MAGPFASIFNAFGRGGASAPPPTGAAPAPVASRGIFGGNGNGFTAAPGSLFSAFGAPSQQQRIVQQQGDARGRVMARLGELQAQGVPPAQLLGKILGDPVFAEAFHSDPDIGTTVQSVVKAITDMNTPAVGSVAAGASLYTQLPGQGPNFTVPGAPDVTGGPGDIPGLTENERAMNRLVQAQVLDGTTRDKILAGVLSTKPVLGPQGQIIGYQIVDLSSGAMVKSLPASPDADAAFGNPQGGGVQPGPAPSIPTAGQPPPGPQSQAQPQPQPQRGQQQGTLTAQPPGAYRSFTSQDQPPRGGTMTADGNAGLSYSGWVARAPQQYQGLYTSAGAKYGVPPDLLAKQGKAESSFNPIARSDAGALGIAQFMPGTAKRFGINPLDPAQSIDAQANYMSQLLRRYNGNVNWALAGYNWGEGNVDRWVRAGANPGRLPAETQNYIASINGTGQGLPEAAAQDIVPADQVVPLDTLLTPKSDGTLSDPTDMFIGAGALPMTGEIIGGITGQIDPSLANIGNTNVTRTALRNYRSALSDLSNSGRILSKQYAATLANGPSMGPLTNPIDEINKAIAVRGQVENFRNQAIVEINDPALGPTAATEASKDLVRFDRILGALPTTAQMQARLALLQQGKGGQITPSAAIDAAGKLINKVGGEVKTDVQTAIAPPQGGDKLTAIRSASTIQELTTVAVAPLSEEERAAAEQRYNELNTKGQ